MLSRRVLSYWKPQARLWCCRGAIIVRRRGFGHGPVVGGELPILPLPNRKTANLEPAVKVPVKPTTTTYPRLRLPSTFTPSDLRPEDYRDLSGIKGFLLRGDSREFWFHYVQRDRKPVLFPPKTQGYFYLFRPAPHQHPEESAAGDIPIVQEACHPAAGELRFRVMEQPDPARFDEGADLLTPDGIPWGMHLLTISKASGLQVLLQRMLTEKEHTAMQEFLARSRLHPHHYEKTANRSTILNSIHDPFLVDFKKNVKRLVLLDRDVVAKIELRHWLYVQRPHTSAGDDSTTQPHPYSGKALVRFDIALWERKNEGPAARPALRILKWYEPPSPDDIACQTEGELVKKWDWETGRERILTIKRRLLPEASFKELVERRWALAETLRHRDEENDGLSYSSLDKVTIQLGDLVT
ncbi:hypothetical protein NMY22_g1634 [Coprinellus aureogranulatus]|nr:hypothetical protein NMY22_g1634 [Coprinellus aureogranulatus]